MNELVRFALAAMFPREGDLPGLAELDLDAKIEGLRRDATPVFWLGLVAAALAFQLLPILTVRRPWPAVFLTEEQLDAHAHALAAHRFYLLRQIVVLLKLVGGLFWGQSPEIRARLTLPAYPGDPGTRRTEPHPARPLLPAPASERSPEPRLLQIGRREEDRGRGRDQRHALTDAIDLDADSHAGADSPQAPTPARADSPAPAEAMG
ncbi:MAG: hypothetical protein R3F14_23035 [Polyangiaceae bacterium]